MDKRKENEILFGQKFSIILSQEMVQMVEREVELLNTVYKDISERLGLDIAVEIHRMYRGQQISFPIRLLNPTVIKQKVIQEYDGTNAKTLAIKYGYSEKTIKRIIRGGISKEQEG